MLNPESGTSSRALFFRRLKLLAVVSALLLLCFARAILRLGEFALHNELFSYIPLIPIISAYLIWTTKEHWASDLAPSWVGALLGALAGSALLIGYVVVARSGGGLPAQDYLSWMTLSFLCFFWGACLALLGSKVMRQIAFPAAFLIFAVPLPAAWVASIDSFFQYTSAAAAAALCELYGTPVLREGLILHLPGFSLRVAPECSGIHSTLVLMMTSLLAGELFLARFWSRAILVLFVVPLAILRNGFRICVVGELCAHLGPQMINSPIHRRGGPLFFALSLLPFFFLLICLRKWESSGSKVSKPQSLHPIL